MTAPNALAEVSRRMERGILILFTAAAGVIGIALLLPAARELIQVLSGEAVISLLTTADLAHTAADAGPSIVSATYDSARVVASDLSSGTAWMLGLGVAFSGLTIAVTAGAAVFFFLMLMWRRPFHLALVVATQIAGSALLIGSLLSVGIGGLGRMQAASELNPLANDVFIVGFAFDPAIMLVGLVVLSLSFVFARGLTLQHDTKGLI